MSDSETGGGDSNKRGRGRPKKASEPRSESKVRFQFFLFKCLKWFDENISITVLY